jgi:hypothetical protein
MYTTGRLRDFEIVVILLISVFTPFPLPSVFMHMGGILYL